MRVQPTFEMSSTITDLKMTNYAATNWVLSALVLEEGSTYHALLKGTTTAMTANQSILLASGAANTGYVAFNAEL